MLNSSAPKRRHAEKAYLQLPISSVMITQCAPSSRRRTSGMLLTQYGPHCTHSDESSTPIVSYINIECLGQHMLSLIFSSSSTITLLHL